MELTFFAGSVLSKSKKLHDVNWMIAKISQDFIGSTIGRKFTINFNDSQIVFKVCIEIRMEDMTFDWIFFEFVGVFNPIIIDQKPNVVSAEKKVF